MLADAIGGDEATALAAMTDPAIKDRVRAETASAEARGVFGTPTFAMGDELYWGYDRLDFVARATA